MRILAIFTVFVLLFTSCTHTVQDQSSEISLDSINLVDSEGVAEIDEISDSIQFGEYMEFMPLQDIPEVWYHLTDLEGDLVVFDPCFEQNPSIRIIYFPDDGGSPRIHIGFAQDGFTFDLKYVKKTETGIQVICADNRILEFVWTNKTKGLGKWTIPDVFNDYLFVEEASLGDFENVREECDDEF